MTASVGTSANWRNWVLHLGLLHLGLHHLNPPSLDSKFTSKGNLGKNTKCSKGQRDADSSISKLRQQWTIVFLLFNSSPFNVSKGFLIYLFNGVMEGWIRAISRHMEGQETSDSDPHQGKLRNYLAFCTHLDVRGFRVISTYIREKGIKSCVQQIMSVFRDDLDNMKGTKIVHGSKESVEGQGRP